MKGEVTHNHLIERLSAIYTDSEIVQWLSSPQPLLDNITPLRLIERDGALGTDAIHELLDQIDSGVYL